MRPSFRRFAFQLIYFWITFWTSCGLNVLGIPVPRAMIRYFAMVGLLFVSKTNGGLGNRQVGVTTGPLTLPAPQGEDAHATRARARRPCLCPSATRGPACRRAPRPAPW